MTRRAPLVLLPPSESKYEPARGKAIELAALSFPPLTALRSGLLDDALRSAPAVAAGRLYTGVLYDALGIATLPARAARNIVIVSAQFGRSGHPTRFRPTGARWMPATGARRSGRRSTRPLPEGRARLPLGDLRGGLAAGAGIGRDARSCPGRRGAGRRAARRLSLREEDARRGCAARALRRRPAAHCRRAARRSRRAVPLRACAA